MHSTKLKIFWLLYLLLVLPTFSQPGFFEDLNLGERMKEAEVESVQIQESDWIEDSYIEGHGPRNPLLVYKRGRRVKTQTSEIHVEERTYRSGGIRNEKYLVHLDLREKFLEVAQDVIFGGPQMVLSEDGPVEVMIFIATLPEEITYSTTRVEILEERTYELLAAPALLKYIGPYAKVGITNKEKNLPGSLEYLVDLKTSARN